MADNPPTQRCGNCRYWRPLTDFAPAHDEDGTEHLYGHWPICLVMVRATGGDWEHATGGDDRPHPWFAGAPACPPVYCETLADALIVAEIDPDHEPIPF